MFLFIFENGVIQKSESYTEDDLKAADDYLIDIVSIFDPDLPTQYHDGDWRPIENIK